MQEKWDEKVTARYIFQNTHYFFIFFLPFILRYVKKCTQFLECYCFYIPYIFSYFYFWMLQFTDRFSSLNHQAYWQKKKIGSKCYLKISNFLKTLVWLLSFWIEYENNYLTKINIYLCNLRWHHDRFPTLRRCYWGIFNFPTLRIWQIDLLGTCYIHANFQTCRICRTAELEVPTPFFCFFLHYCYKLHLKLLQKQISITLLWLNLKI